MSDEEREDMIDVMLDEFNEMPNCELEKFYQRAGVSSELMHMPWSMLSSSVQQKLWSERYES